MIFASVKSNFFVQKTPPEAASGGACMRFSEGVFVRRALNGHQPLMPEMAMPPMMCF